jgi:hypothetical protein
LQKKKEKKLRKRNSTVAEAMAPNPSDCGIYAPNVTNFIIQDCRINGFPVGVNIGGRGNYVGQSSIVSPLGSGAVGVRSEGDGLMVRSNLIAGHKVGVHSEGNDAVVDSNRISQDSSPAGENDGEE